MGFQNMLVAGLAAVVVGIVIYILANVNTQHQERSISSVQQRTLRTSEADLISMIEFDFQNIGSNYPDYDNHPDSAIVGFDTSGSTKYFEFVGQVDPGSPPNPPPAPVTVRYEWAPAPQTLMLRDGSYQNVDVYTITRYLDGTASGYSSGVVTRFEIGLLQSDGTPVADLADTRQVSVGISMASNLGASSHVGETHWDSIIRPTAMARLDYEDYLE